MQSVVQGKIPVIIDTDLGGDIDDTWALIMLLKMEKFNIKLITISGYDTFYQAKLAAKILTVANREDIPIAYNIPQDSDGGPQEKWMEEFDLKNYMGQIYTSTLPSMIDCINKEEQKTYLFSIAAKANIAELLRNYTEAQDRCILYSMQSSIKKEFIDTNVRMDVAACRQVMASNIKKYIIPLDVCGHTYLDGEYYQMLIKSNDKLTMSLIENYTIWWNECDWNKKQQDINVESSTLYDVIALLAMDNLEDFEHEITYLNVLPNGRTIIDQEKGNMTVCIFNIKDEQRIKQKIVDILLS
jgi:inosine-uridine nucleoside N-ribohydrolase